MDFVLQFWILEEVYDRLSAIFKKKKNWARTSANPRPGSRERWATKSSLTSDQPTTQEPDPGRDYWSTPLFGREGRKGAGRKKRVPALSASPHTHQNMLNNSECCCRHSQELLTRPRSCTENCCVKNSLHSWWIWFGRCTKLEPPNWGLRAVGHEEDMNTCVKWFAPVPPGVLRMCVCFGQK